MNDDKFQPPRAVRYPDAVGWWARRSGGRIEWFFVDLVAVTLSDGLKTTGDLRLMVFYPEIEDFIPVDRFSTPLTRWYGPIQPKFEL